MNLLHSIFICLLFTGCQAKPTENQTNNQKEAAHDTLAKIDQYLLQLEKEKGFSGAFLVVKNGKRIFGKGYGWASKEKNQPFTPSTLASMGSITKAFTAAAIMKLAEQGKLSVKDRLQKFFPNVPSDKAQITLHQLLTHSAGFAEMLDGDEGDYQKIETGLYLERAFAQPLIFAPGTKAVYTNVSMSILGIVIEQVSGMDYEVFLKKELFSPLGIKHIGYQYPTEPGLVIAHGYQGSVDWGTHQSHFEAVGGGPWWNLKANGGLEASLDDMERWIQGISNHTILSKSSTDQMFTPHIVEDNTEGRYFFGYGCNTETSRRNTKVIDNGGSNGIYFARLVRYPEEDVVFYMVTNQQDMPTHKVLPNVQQLYFLGRIETDVANLPPQWENPQAETLYNLLKKNSTRDVGQLLTEQKMDVRDDMVLLEAGQKLMDEHQTETAINLFEFYTRQFPSIVVAHNNLGDLYLQTGQKEKAKTCYRAALKIRPNNPRAKTALAKLEAANK